jgi:hypothetical protein
MRPPTSFDNSFHFCLRPGVRLCGCTGILVTQPEPPPQGAWGWGEGWPVLWSRVLTCHDLCSHTVGLYGNCPPVCPLPG